MHADPVTRVTGPAPSADVSLTQTRRAEQAREGATMNLLISELQPLDAVLDWPTLWAENLDGDQPFRPVEIEPSDYLEPLPTEGLPAWYEPRISALRKVIIGR
jgi:hypothetical protein